MASLIETNEIIESAQETFELFCNDISTMFDVVINGKQTETSTGTFKELRKKFKSLCCLWVFNDVGTLNSDFYAMVDKQGLFTLGGTFVMHPDQIIIKNRNHGGKDESKDIEDAVGEVGNLLSGSLDRFFRENYESHQSIKQKATTIADFSPNLELFNGDKEREFTIVDFEIEVEPFEPFNFSIMFPLAVEQETEQEKQEPSPENKQADTTPQQTEQKQETETKPEDKTEQAKPEQSPQQPNTENDQEQASPVSQAIQNLVHNTDVNTGSISEILNSIQLTDIINKDVIFISPDESLENALSLMQNKAASHIIVGDQEKPNGVLSRNDLENGISPYLKPAFSKLKRPQDTATLKFKVKWLMAQPIYSIPSNQSMRQAIKIMADNDINFVPVTDADGKIIGSLTSKQILQLFLA